MSEGGAVPVGVMGASGMSLEGGAIEIRDAAVNVEEIMTRVRKGLEERRRSHVFREDLLLAQDLHLFPSGESVKMLADRVALLNYLARVDLEGEAVRSHRPIFGVAIKWLKRLSRFWVRKYTDGIFARQNHFNVEVSALLSELSRQLEDQKAETQRLREQLEALQKR